LDGDIAINRTNTSDNANAMFDHCLIIGRSGPAVSSTETTGILDQFQSCTFSNALQLTGPGVFNVVNSTLLGSTQCVMAANATRAAFHRLHVQSGGQACEFWQRQQSAGGCAPIHFERNPDGVLDNVANDISSRRPAKTNLYVVTDAAWGANGDGVASDTAAIQSALNAAGAGGGGIVFCRRENIN